MKQARVIVLYVNLYPETRSSVLTYAPSAEFIDTSATDYSYWEAIRDHWTGESDLVCIDQDIEINVGTLPSFAACPERWCSFGYPIACASPLNGNEPQAAWITDALGCTRFSAELQRTYPLETTHSLRHQWQFLDRHLASTMAFYHVAPHVHGYVSHHHRYKLESWQRVFEEAKANPPL